MAEAAIAEAASPERALDAALLLAALPEPVVALDEAGRVRFVNPAAEQFFDAGANLLQGRGLADLVPFGSPLLGLVEQVRDTQIGVSERGVDLGTSSTGPKPVDIRVSPLADRPALHCREDGPPAHPPGRRPHRDGHGPRARPRDQEPALGHSRRRPIAGAERRRGRS
jgi:PAS domain-containing protein